MAARVGGEPSSEAKTSGPDFDSGSHPLLPTLPDFDSGSPPLRLATLMTLCQIRFRGKTLNTVSFLFILEEETALSEQSLSIALRLG